MSAIQNNEIPQRRRQQQQQQPTGWTLPVLWQLPSGWRIGHPTTTQDDEDQRKDDDDDEKHLNLEPAIVVADEECRDGAEDEGESERHSRKRSAATSPQDWNGSHVSASTAISTSSSHASDRYQDRLDDDNDDNEREGREEPAQDARQDQDSPGLDRSSSQPPPHKKRRRRLDHDHAATFFFEHIPTLSPPAQQLFEYASPALLPLSFWWTGMDSGLAQSWGWFVLFCHALQTKVSNFEEPTVIGVPPQVSSSSSTATTTTTASRRLLPNWNHHWMSPVVHVLVDLAYFQTMCVTMCLYPTWFFMVKNEDVEEAANVLLQSSVTSSHTTRQLERVQYLVGFWVILMSLHFIASLKMEHLRRCHTITAKAHAGSGTGNIANTDAANVAEAHAMTQLALVLILGGILIFQGNSTASISTCVGLALFLVAPLWGTWRFEQRSRIYRLTDTKQKVR